MSTRAHNIFERIKRKVDKVCKGSRKVEKKALFELIVGMMTSRDIKLSNIGRSLKEGCDIIQTEKRLSRNVKRHEFEEKINRVMLQEVLCSSTGNEIISIDTSDIVKNYAEKMENMGLVHDGSTGEFGNGYNMLVSGLITKKKVVPMYLETYSTFESGYITRWFKVKKLLDEISKQSKRGIPIGTIVMDRGFDAMHMYKYMINKGLNFIVRMKSTRKITVGKRRMKVKDVFDFLSTKELISDVIHEKKSKRTKIKIGHTMINIEGYEDNLTLIVIKSKYYSEPMYLITNLKCCCYEAAKLIYEKYLSRWGIETLIRTLKEEYNIEDVRLLKYKGIKNIISIAFFCLFLISKIVYDIGNKTNFIKLYLISLGKRIKRDGCFLYHAISEGISAVFLAYPKKFVPYPVIKSNQLLLFKDKFFG